MTLQLTSDSRAAISRARFFLNMAKTSPPEARVEFEAFLEAAIVFARAAVHRFKSKHEQHRDWKDWWDSLRGDPAMNFVRTERDWILKEAPPQLGQKVFGAFIGSGDAQEPVRKPANAAELYYFEDPSTPATATVERHLESVASLLEEAERKFR